MGLELVLIGAIAASSLLLLAFGLRGATGEAKLRRRLGTLSGRGDYILERGTVGWLRPFSRILVGGAKDRQEIAQQLRAAGFYDPQSILVFAGLRLAATVLAIAAAALVLWYTGRWSGAARFLPLAAGGVVYVFSKMALRWLAAGRLRRVNAELPFTLDVLLLMLESGISLDQCFRSLALTEGGAVPLVKQAVRALVEDLQRGMPYEAAFDRWADRLGVGGAHELAGLFRQTLVHGTELGPALREFVREFSDRRISAARESIGRKTTKMTVVMIIFLMPALFIVLAGPATVAIFATLGGASQ